MPKGKRCYHLKFKREKSIPTPKNDETHRAAPGCGSLTPFLYRLYESGKSFVGSDDTNLQRQWSAKTESLNKNKSKTLKTKNKLETV